MDSCSEPSPSKLKNPILAVRKLSKKIELLCVITRFCSASSSNIAPRHHPITLQAITHKCSTSSPIAITRQVIPRPGKSFRSCFEIIAKLGRTTADRKGRLNAYSKPSPLIRGLCRLCRSGYCSTPSPTTQAAGIIHSINSAPRHHPYLKTIKCVNKRMCVLHAITHVYGWVMPSVYMAPGAEMIGTTLERRYSVSVMSCNGKS